MHPFLFVESWGLLKRWKNKNFGEVELQILYEALFMQGHDNRIPDFLEAKEEEKIVKI